MKSNAICAIATAKGSSALGVIRISGENLEPLISPSIQVGSVFHSKEEESLVNQLKDTSLLQDSDIDHS